MEIISFIKNSKIYNNTAIIYDIDDTVIDKYGNPIWPILSTYKYALSKGLKVFIITARVDTFPNNENTIRQLKSVGMGEFEMIFLRPYYMADIAKYKLIARKIINDMGFNVIASIGDMPWDMGAYGGKGFLVNDYIKV